MPEAELTAHVDVIHRNPHIRILAAGTAHLSHALSNPCVVLRAVVNLHITRAPSPLIIRIKVQGEVLLRRCHGNFSGSRRAIRGACHNGGSTCGNTGHQTVLFNPSDQFIIGRPSHILLGVDGCSKLHGLTFNHRRCAGGHRHLGGGGTGHLELHGRADIGIRCRACRNSDVIIAAVGLRCHDATTGVNGGVVIVRRGPHHAGRSPARSDGGRQREYVVDRLVTHILTIGICRAIRTDNADTSHRDRGVMNVLRPAGFSIRTVLIGVLGQVPRGPGKPCISIVGIDLRPLKGRTGSLVDNRAIAQQILAGVGGNVRIRVIYLVDGAVRLTGIACQNAVDVRVERITADRRGFLQIVGGIRREINHRLNGTGHRISVAGTIISDGQQCVRIVHGVVLGAVYRPRGANKSVSVLVNLIPLDTHALGVELTAPREVVAFLIHIDDGCGVDGGTVMLRLSRVVHAEVFAHVHTAIGGHMGFEATVRYHDAAKQIGGGIIVHGGVGDAPR